MRIPPLLLAVPLLLAASLARAGDPAPAAARTPEEVAAEVHRLLEEGYSARCSSGYCESIAALGHDAMAPLLEGIRGLKADHPGDSLSCGAVALLAGKDDVPALRGLLLAGRVNLARALERLQAKGCTEATDALLDALAGRVFDSDVLRALAEAPDRERVAKAILKVVGDGRKVEEEDRAELAGAFGTLGVRDAASILREWAGISRRPRSLVAIGHALVKLGEVKGVEVLLHVAAERRTRFPCRPSTPGEEAAASAPGRLCPEGFDDSDRERAIEALGRIAGKGIFDLPEYWRRDLPRQGPDATTPDEFLDRGAAAFRKWWEASKERLRYDRETGAWVVGP